VNRGKIGRHNPNHQPTIRNRTTAPVSPLAGILWSDVILDCIRFWLRRPPTSAGQSMPINTAVNSNNNHHLEKLKLRESLTAEIVADVEYEINDLLAWAPEGLTERDRKAIRDEVMAQTRLVTDAWSTEELQNEGARRAYTCGAVATARQMINLQMAQTKRN
jgi:hypothetical protein